MSSLSVGCKATDVSRTLANPQEEIERIFSRHLGEEQQQQHPRSKRSSVSPGRPSGKSTSKQAGSTSSSREKKPET